MRKEWLELILDDEIEVNLDKVVISAMVDHLLIPDMINPFIFKNNYVTLLEYEQVNDVSVVEQIEVQSFHGLVSPSIKELIVSEARLESFPLWFIAAYPDVMCWFIINQNEFLLPLKGNERNIGPDVLYLSTLKIWGLNNGDMEELNKNNRLTDANKQYHPFVLRRLVDRYKLKTAKALEAANAKTLDVSKKLYKHPRLLKNSSEIGKNFDACNNCDLTNHDLLSSKKPRPSRLLKPNLQLPRILNIAIFTLIIFALVATYTLIDDLSRSTISALDMTIYILFIVLFVSTAIGLRKKQYWAYIASILEVSIFCVVFIVITVVSSQPHSPPYIFIVPFVFFILLSLLLLGLLKKSVRKYFNKAD